MNLGVNARTGTALLAAALLSACSPAGPNYRPPATGVSVDPRATGRFASAAGDAFQQAPLPDRWWRLYDDPKLDALVTEALAANADLRAADANLRKADAVLAETAAQKSLSTVLSGGATLARSSGTGASLPGTVGTSLGIDLAYPLDLKGKIARAIEASSADREAVAAARDAVRAEIAAAVTGAYVGVCAANYQQGVTTHVVALQRETLDVTTRLARGGRGTSFDVSRAQAAVDASAASLPAFAAKRQAALYLLATLMGRAPSAYPAGVESCDRLPVLARPIPVGDGAALIRRRADVRAAERTLAADTARIGVATADLYPSVSLGGSFGMAGPVSSFGNGSTFGFSLGPLVSWSFPNRPVVKAQIAAAGAEADGDLARFDSTVLAALRQTETALETYARDREQAAALQRARDSAGLSGTQAARLFRFGRSDFLSLLSAQASLASAEATAAAAQVQLVDDQVALFTALGGGWEQGPATQAGG